MTERYFPDSHYVAQGIDADAYSSGSGYGSPIDGHGYGRGCMIANLGDIATAGTIHVENSATSAGSFTDITGATMTDDGSGDNETYLVDFPLSNSYPWLKVHYTVAGNWDLGVSIVLYKPNTSTPPTQQNTAVHA